MNQEFLTPDEVGMTYRVSRSAVLLWIKSGRLPGVKVGNQYRIRRSDLDNFVQEVGPAERQPEEG